MMDLPHIKKETVHDAAFDAMQYRKFPAVFHSKTQE
jgi:hypothetical protein